MSIYKSFKIEEGELSKISRRLVVRNIKLISIPLLFVTVAQYFRWGKNEPLFFLGVFCLLIFLFGISLLLGNAISKKTMHNFEMGFDNERVFIKTNQLVKSISWTNIELDKIGNDYAKLIDKSIPKYKRFIFGIGVYRIPFEIYQRSDIISEINSRR
jgi:hypothetical protein